MKNWTAVNKNQVTKSSVDILHTAQFLVSTNPGCLLVCDFSAFVKSSLSLHSFIQSFCPRQTYMVEDKVHLQQDGALGAMYQLLVLQSIPPPLTVPDLQQL